MPFVKATIGNGRQHAQNDYGSLRPRRLLQPQGLADQYGQAAEYERVHQFVASFEFR